MEHKGSSKESGDTKKDKIIRVLDVIIIIVLLIVIFMMFTSTSEKEGNANLRKSTPKTLMEPDKLVI